MSSSRHDQTPIVPITPRDLDTLYTALTNGIDSQMVAMAVGLTRVLPNGMSNVPHQVDGYRYSICAALAILLRDRVLLPLVSARVPS